MKFVKDMIEKINGSHKCEHKNIRWINSLCMIAGYKQEGICLDCNAIMLKDSEGKVVEK